MFTSVWAHDILEISINWSRLTVQIPLGLKNVFKLTKVEGSNPNGAEKVLKTYGPLWSTYAPIESSDKANTLTGLWEDQAVRKSDSTWKPMSGYYWNASWNRYVLGSLSCVSARIKWPDVIEIVGGPTKDIDNTRICLQKKILIWNDTKRPDICPKHSKI